MSQSLRKTHLYEFHKLRGHVVSFAGFEMPMWYNGIIAEHMLVRNAVGIFDVSHMGRVVIEGPGAEDFLNFVTTNDVSSLSPLSAHYSTMCNNLGGVKDDFVIFRLESEKFLIVPNAINRSKDYEWLVKQSQAFDVKITDVSDNVAMFAVQGPRAEHTLQKMCGEDLIKIRRFKVIWDKLVGVDVFVSRTGYTGEDGFELFVWNTPVSNPESATKIWNAILQAGKDAGIEPCGLGSRNTLRLEAGMCLYGNDIDENTSPLEAGLSFVVKFKKGDFVGKEALLKQKTEGLKRKRVGVQMLERGIPRQNDEVWKKGEKIGRVTSGTFSPLLKRGIAMTYLPTEYATKGTNLKVRIRKRLVKGEVVKFPFYDVKKYGFRRET